MLCEIKADEEDYACLRLALGEKTPAKTRKKAGEKNPGSYLAHDSGKPAIGGKKEP
jgi:hypothetical protein